MDSIIESFSLYYGLDWAGITLGLMGSFLVSNRQALGFLVMCAGAVCSLAVAILSNQYGFMVGNTLFIAMHLRGFLNWTRPATVFVRQN